MLVKKSINSAHYYMGCTIRCQPDLDQGDRKGLKQRKKRRISEKVEGAGKEKDGNQTSITELWEMK